MRTEISSGRELTKSSRMRPSSVSVTTAGIEEHAVFFFTTERTRDTGEETVYSRMLAPGFGIAEDPATGGASGPLGCYLLHHGLVTGDAATSITSLQGAAIGRPSRIHIEVASQGGEITRVRVGGRAVLVATGQMQAA